MQSSWLPRSVCDELERGNYSRPWRGLLTICDGVRDGVKWNIRNGHRVEFWNDTWIDQHGPLCSMCLHPSTLDHSTVAQWVMVDGQWDWQRLGKEVLNFLMPYDYGFNLIGKFFLSTLVDQNRAANTLAVAARGKLIGEWIYNAPPAYVTDI
ncbi:hypothetical protein V6N13_106472 [Hibiscus sabdariffa]